VYTAFLLIIITYRVTTTPRIMRTREITQACECVNGFNVLYQQFIAVYYVRQWLSDLL